MCQKIFPTFEHCLKSFVHKRINLSPFTKDFRVRETPIENSTYLSSFPWGSTKGSKTWLIRVRQFQKVRRTNESTLHSRYLKWIQKEFTGWQFAFEINWPLDSTFAHEAGKHHQTFPNVSAHQIIDIIAQVERINKNGKLLLKKCWSQQHPVFPGGHPSKYWLGSMLLNFSDRTRTGAFNMIWPLAKIQENVNIFISTTHTYLLT